MRRTLVIGSVCLLLTSTLPVGCGDQTPGNGVAQGNGDAGPELALTGMEMTEVRPAGVRYRLTADRATYALAGKTVTATGVAFGLREHAGDIRVTAPSVSWNVEGQSAEFPEGCDAGYPGGYSAKVPVAKLDLRDRVLTAAGPSTFSGPGFTTAGADLVWRWREGKADLKQPKTVIFPGSVSAFKRG